MRQLFYQDTLHGTRSGAIRRNAVMPCPQPGAAYASVFHSATARAIFRLDGLCRRGTAREMQAIVPRPTHVQTELAARRVPALLSCPRHFPTLARPASTGWLRLSA